MLARRQVLNAGNNALSGTVELGSLASIKALILNNNRITKLKGRQARKKGRGCGFLFAYLGEEAADLSGHPESDPRRPVGHAGAEHTGHLPQQVAPRPRPLVGGARFLRRASTLSP